MPNIIISGINGKMGRLVYSSAKQNGFDVACGIDKCTVGEFDCPVYKSFDEIRCDADVVIDFSCSDNIFQLLKYCKDTTTPTVICTTGYTKNQEETILSASKIIPIFKASNTSFGIEVLKKLCLSAQKILSGFDIEIIETHHREKKDSPSGTAQEIFSELQNAKNHNPIYGRVGKSKRLNNDIGIHSVRGGTVIGEHEVIFFGQNESLSIKHIAESKQLFADGAIKAAKYIIGKKNGLYGMNDLFI